MQSYGLLTFLIFLFEPVENILTVEEKTELVRVALFPQQLQFSILHAEILTMFEGMEFARKGYYFAVKQLLNSFYYQYDALA